MGCCLEDSVRVSKMALEMKSGPMLWYKKRVFGRNWRDVHAVLYNDSTLAWFQDKSRAEQAGGLVVKEAPELVAAGPYTAQVPDRPPLPDHYGPNDLVAFGTRGRQLVQWFLCPNEQEVASWMTAISNTLPPPPAPPQPATNYEAPPPVPTAPPNGLPPAPGPAPYGPPQHPTPYNGRAPSGLPGQYPHQMGHNSVAPLPPIYATGPPNGNTTVVVQDRGYDRGGGGDFAMGMLMGGALGATWGAHSHAPGFGWGYGAGWGGGHHSSSTVVNDNDVTVNNYYDYDHTTVNNDVHVSQDVIAQDDVISGDLMGGDFDGGDFGGDFGDF